MIIRTLGISKSAPAEGNKIGSSGDIHISIHAIVKAAMVYPNMICAAVYRNQVVAAHIDRTRTKKSKVAHNDILAFVANGKNARLTIFFFTVAGIIDKQLTHFGFASLVHFHAIR